MNRKNYISVNVACVLQQAEEITKEDCLNGVFSKTEDGFKFEEAVKTRRGKRNPKLFDGNYCSLVHMQNGKYQIHMKTINASAVEDANTFAFQIYSELLDAFNVMQ